MSEQKRVSDERLAELLDTHAQAWVDNWNDGELAVWDADKELQSYKDLATILRELQRRRAERCETCGHWFQESKRAPDDTRGWCMVNSGLYWWASDSCSRWQSKEQMPIDTDGESG